MTPEFKAQLLAWLNHNAPMLGVGFVAVCAVLSFRTKPRR